MSSRRSPWAIVALSGLGLQVAAAGVVGAGLGHFREPFLGILFYGDPLPTIMLYLGSILLVLGILRSPVRYDSTLRRTTVAPFNMARMVRNASERVARARGHRRSR